MKKIVLLWIDVTHGVTESTPPDEFTDIFELRKCGDTNDAAAQIPSVGADAICLDFDYPDQAALMMAKKLKRFYPSLPMIILTLQHSESLAVWAFRNGFIDFLVKPVDEKSVLRCAKALERIREAKKGQRDRRMERATDSLPSEIESDTALIDKDIVPAIRYVAEHYREKICTHDAALRCSLSNFQFARKFKEAVGVPFRDYVVRFRLREAYRKLREPGVSIGEVAYSTGFNDLSYFSRMYKRHFGQSPSASKLAVSACPDRSPTAKLRLPVLDDYGQPGRR